MARIRTIKPSFFVDDEVAELEPLDRLAWIGLWCCADKAGRIEDRPAKLRVQILPYDEGDFAARLERLAVAKRIIRYTGPDGKAYIQVVNWEEHQKPHHTEPESTIPSPETHQSAPAPFDNGFTTVPKRAGREGKGKEGKGEREGSGDEAPASPSSADADQPTDPDIDQSGLAEYREFERELVETWNALPCPPFTKVVKLSDDRRKHIRARFGEPLFRDNVAALIDRIRGSTFMRGSNDRSWIVSFDWLIKNDQNYTKILEGKYDDRKNGTAHAPTNGTYRPPGGTAGANARDRSITRTIPDFARSRLLAIDDLDERVREATRLGVIPDRATPDEVRALS